MDKTNNIFLQKTQLQTLNIMNSENKSGDSDICNITTDNSILDLNCDIYLINSNVLTVRVPIPTGDQKTIITLTIITPTEEGINSPSASVVIQTSNGKFQMDQYNKTFQLCYSSGNWIKIGNNTYMYPVSPDLKYTNITGNNYLNNTAISADGNTVAYVLSNTNTSGSNINISTFISNTWVTQTLSINYLYRIALSLSADGKTLAVSSSVASENFGYKSYVYVYVLTTNWNLQWTHDYDNGNVGYSISLSADGNTLALGTPYEHSIDTSTGSVYIYVRYNNIWNNNYTKLVYDNDNVYNQGLAISLSADGNILVVNALVAANDGNVCVWNRDNNNTWTSSPSLISPYTPEDESRYFGECLSLSADGKTLAITNKNYNNTGSVYIYRYTADTYSYTANLIPDSVENSGYGTGVSLSADGNMVVFGGIPSADNDTFFGPYIYVYNNEWIIIPSSIISLKNNSFGVSCSAIGNTILSYSTTTIDSSNVFSIDIYR